MSKIQRIVILGAGNLATQLTCTLHESELEIVQVFSRTEKSAKELANRFNSAFTTKLEELVQDADLYIFALSDKALLPVLESISIPKGRFVHTAGSIPMDVFHGHTNKFGVFYPLQTFSKNRRVSFQKIPICIEANNEELQEDLKELAGRISTSQYLVSSDQRKQLHLAAVFTCNFANHMYSIGQKLLEDKGLDFDLLKPLIQETAEKVSELDPVSAQTGPAVRFDEETMSSHEKALKATPDFQKLYRFVSESIFKMHNKDS
ncbi:Rossmann-like and DUF2520 domain-containing protein [Labilibaculum sp.]|uniref:Rossmann-like and DUF2520 domain-containing protein n=1 Tax=Labilibaculum sp. TaxID=2060723 RepID=UPI003566FD12